MTSPDRTSPLRDFRTLFLLFVGLRAILLIAHDPAGLMTYGEFWNFYNLADITRLTGKLPFIGYWSEYPPLFVWLNLGIHQSLLVWQGLGDHAYFYALSLLALLADCGNLWLIRKLGERLYGSARGLDIAWAYALIGVPLVFLMWNFETLTTFFMLLGLWWFLEGRDGRSALAIAAGALTKVMPGLLVPVVWRYRSLRKSAYYTGQVLVLGLLAYAPFFMISPEFTIASLRSQLSKSSWQSIWGVIDGNLTTGNFGALMDRLDPAKAGVMVGNPPLIPSWLVLLIFGAVFFYLFTRPMRETSRAQVAFFGMTWCVFLLWSKGWSTPWMQMIFPLILLVFPDREGILGILIFSLINFIEWPLLLSRGFFWGLYITAPLRTLFLIGLLVAFFRRCSVREATYDSY